MTNKELNDKIEAKLISRIAHYRLSIRAKFRNRHHAAWPELTYKTIMGDIRDLKVWLHMAKLIQPTHNPPYTTYLAKQLTHDNTRT